MITATRIDDPTYAVQAIVVSLDAAEPQDPRVWRRVPDDEGLSVLLRWTCPQSGRVLHIAVAAPMSAPASVLRALMGLHVGDEVFVEGPIECISWPGVVGDLAVMRIPRAVQVVRKAMVSASLAGSPTKGPEQ